MSGNRHSAAHRLSVCQHVATHHVQLLRNAANLQLIIEALQTLVTLCDTEAEWPPSAQGNTAIAAVGSPWSVRCSSPAPAPARPARCLVKRQTDERQAVCDGNSSVCSQRLVSEENTVHNHRAKLGWSPIPVTVAQVDAIVSNDGTRNKRHLEHRLVVSDRLFASLSLHIHTESAIHVASSGGWERAFSGALPGRSVESVQSFAFHRV